MLKTSGRDCEVPVTPGSPFNVCPTHYRAIKEYLAEARGAATLGLPLSMPCPSCGTRALFGNAISREATCSACGHVLAAIDALRLANTTPQAVERNRMPLRRPTTTVVYYIRFGDRIKIGTTNNLERRMTALPHDEVLLTEPGSYELERQRHEQFNRLLIAGREWFEAHPDLLDFIEQRKAELAAA